MLHNDMVSQKMNKTDRKEKMLRFSTFYRQKDFTWIEKQWLRCASLFFGKQDWSEYFLELSDFL